MLQRPAPYRSDIYDQFTPAITTIDQPHRIAHDGFMYHVSGKITGLVDTGSIHLLMITAAANFPHLQRMTIDVGSGDINILTYEGTVTSDNGTAQSPRNTNRNSSNTPDLNVFVAPTVTNVGTLIHTNWVPPTATGVGQSPGGFSDVSNGEEWILKPSTKYLTRVTNNSGGTISVRFELLWYEPDY